MRIATVLGTRPQLIKAAALQPWLTARHETIVIDTGQHYDEAMAGAFFTELGLARPEHSLGIGGGDHGEQTGRMLIALEPLLAGWRPAIVLVYGDTNSTLAGALAAAKLGLPVAHVEAGLRSFDRRMPEELNRVVVDRLSSWLFAPTPTAVANLRAEGLTERVHLVGDLMQDLAARVAADVSDPEALARAESAIAAAGAPELTGSLRPGGYIVATIHRAENREPAAMSAWARILSDAARPERPVILALHPGTREAMAEARLTLGRGVEVVEPLGYRTSLTLQLHAAAVITDSGGVQREAAWLGTPCLVIRGTTEWVEAVEASNGRIVVVGLNRARAAAELVRLAPPGEAEALALERAHSLRLEPSGAAEAIVSILSGAEV